MTSTSTLIETLAVPLDGLSEASVRIGFGGGELTVGQAEPGTLVSGTFEGGVIQKSGAPGRIELEPRTPGLPLVKFGPVYWNLGVTAEIPVDLRLDTGANRSTIDLTSLQIPRLEIHTGASETTIRLPAAGRTSVRIECGFALVTVQVPQGVAARIRGTMALGSTEVNGTRFPRESEGWASADYGTAPNRVDISIQGGFGTVRVA